MSWRSVRSWLCTTSQPPPATTTRATAASARARAPNGSGGSGAMEDLGDRRDGRGDNRTPGRHRVEELRRHLPDRVRGGPLGHRHDVGGDEVVRDLVERDLAEDLHVRQRRPAPYRKAFAIRADQGENHARSEEAHRLDEIVHALVGARRAEEHDDLLPRDAERRPRSGRIVAGGIPGIGVAHVREQAAADALGEEARADREDVGAPDEARRQPRPREPAGVSQVDRPADPAPDPRAVEEPELPVVDVEKQRPTTTRPGEQAETVARRARPRRDDEVAVDQGEQCGHTPKEARILARPSRAVSDTAALGRLPERWTELGADDLDFPTRREEAREQIGPARRVVGEVEGDDRDLHGPAAATNRA